MGIILEARDENNTGLPFSCLLTQIILQSGISIDGEPQMKIQDPISKQTLMKSNALLRRDDQDEDPQPDPVHVEMPDIVLVFVLATFCWTKSLLCNVAAFTGMLLYPESTLQLCSSRRFCEVFKDLFRFPVSHPDDVVFRPDAHQSTTSVPTMRYFRPDSHQCLEASNSSRLQPSGRNGKSFERSSEFEKIPVFQFIRPEDVVTPSGRHSVFDKY
jgi:hypothetical protein